MPPTLKTLLPLACPSDDCYSVRPQNMAAFKGGCVVAVERVKERRALEAVHLRGAYNEDIAQTVLREAGRVGKVVV